MTATRALAAAASFAVVGAAPRPGHAPRALELLTRHGRTSSAALGLNEATRHFTAPGVRGLVAYREAGPWLFSLGGPAAPAEDRAALLAAWLAFARERRRRVCVLQATAADVPLLRAHGLRLEQLGQAYSLALPLALAGGPFVRLRNKLSRARRAGVRVVEVGDGGELPRSAALWEELERVGAAWLAGKGERRLEFLVGELGRPEDVWRRVFVARRGEETLGFLTLLPAPHRPGGGGGGEVGRGGGALLDLSRRDPAGPPGVSELLLTGAAARLHAEGAGWLHLGLTPLAGLGREALDPRATGRSALVAWGMRLLAARGERLYPWRSQAAYKEKWGPAEVVPEWFAHEGRYRPSATWHLLRLTGAL